MKYLILSFILFFSLPEFNSQELYFPPLTGNTWETSPPATYGWCDEKIDSLYQFLEENGTKAFIILKDGRIVLERYFGDFTQLSPWYWASAGKTVTSFMVGIAQQEGLLSISEPTSTYLGEGWTSLTPEQEDNITVWHQLTMTSGLDDSGNLGCTESSCLTYLAEPGTRWSYHNAPYTLLDQVIEGATNTSLNNYTTLKLKQPTGMTGSFVQVESNNVFFSNARSMARFGLLTLNQGNWNGNQIMTDTEYFNQMINTSQDLNESYGYLWWLNGKESFMIPQVQIVFNESFAPNSPSDMVSGLGKDGQFLNVVPSENLVLVRMGEAPDESPVPFQFNDEIWEKVNNLVCNPVSNTNLSSSKFELAPNPSNGTFSIKTELPFSSIEIIDLKGKSLMKTEGINQNTYKVEANLSSGLYLVKTVFSNGQYLTNRLLINAD
jgi:CubicO group peptidase (beta-lactamase class C family)